MTTVSRPPTKRKSTSPSRKPAKRSVATGSGRRTRKASKRAPRVHPRRIVVLIAIVVLAGLGLMFQLVRVQAFGAERYLNYGESQRLRSVEIAGGRGRILDRSGVALSVSLPTPTIAADPRLITDPSGTARVLAPLVGVDVGTLEQRFLRPDSAFAYVSRQVSDEVAAEVEALELPGIYTYEEAARYNPLGESFARSVLGRVDTDHRGVSGLELEFGDELRGTPGQLLFERAKNGTAIPGGVYELEEAIPGADVQITLDRTLQFETERLLQQQVADTNADGGVVIIMVPGTGEILSMASVSRTDDGRVVVTGENRALSWVYEPGSVLKAVTFAGVFEADLAEVDTFTNVPYAKTIFDKEYTDDHFHNDEWWTPVDIMRESSNIGTIQWAEKLGNQGLYSTLTDFGFGSASTLRFPYEENGLLREADVWSGTSLPSIAIGQGIAATPLQVIQSFNIIANGGVYVPPKLVMGTSAPNGELREPPYEPSRRIVEQSTADKLTTMLESVVESGTGRAAAIPGYLAAGKTGTSWKPQPGGGYQDEEGKFHYVATFGGFLPADDPAVSILVVIDEPQGYESEISGGKAAAPLFAKLSRYALQHLRVPPSVASQAVDGSEGTVTGEDGRIRAETESERRIREAKEARERAEGEAAAKRAEQAAEDRAAAEAVDAEEAARAAEAEAERAAQEPDVPEEPEQPDQSDAAPEPEETPIDETQ